MGKTLAAKIVEAQSRPELRFPVGIAPEDIGDIVQSACLMHDFGNPPFGHAGEDAVKNWFKQNDRFLSELSENEKFDLASLEGNAQGFRIITQLENYIFSGGLRLTYAVLGAFHKYPWSSRCAAARSKGKFGAYLAEEKILQIVCDELGLVQNEDNKWCRHPLAYLVEAADDICYALIDVEDAVELGILPFAEARELFLGLLDEADRHDVIGKLQSDKMYRVNFSRLRGPVFEKAVTDVVDAYLAHYDDIMDGSYDGDALGLLASDCSTRITIELAKKLGRERIYLDAKKVELEIGCFATFDILLNNFCDAALQQAKVLEGAKSGLDWKASKLMGLLGDHAPSADNAPLGGWTKSQCLRRAIDFVGGMTDNYAVYIAKQLRGDAFAGR